MTALATVLGQALGIAFATGLNLYLTVAALGLASRLSWIDPLPPSLRGLESAVVIASACILYGVEFVVDKLESLDWVWDALHTIIRPVAAALLVYGFLAPSGSDAQVAGALLGGVVGLAVHGGKAGLRVTLRAGGSSDGCRIVSAAEDVVALTILSAALLAPTGALILVVAILVGVASVGRGLWRASLLGVRALASRLRRFFGGGRWRNPGEIPAGLRSLLPPSPPAAAPPRGARVAAAGLQGVGRFRNGWLVLLPGGPLFLHRSRLRPRCHSIPPILAGAVRAGRWADALELSTGAGALTLHLLKDGPAPELVLRELLEPSLVSSA